MPAARFVSGTLYGVSLKTLRPIRLRAENGIDGAGGRAFFVGGILRQRRDGSAIRFVNGALCQSTFC